MPNANSKDSKDTQPRKTIPDDTVADLLVSTRRRCCLCFFLKGDETQKKVQIAHINRKRDDNRSENLVPLCLDHHDDYDSSTSQSKGFTEEEARRYKKMLIDRFATTPDASVAVVVEHRELPNFGNDLFYGYGVLFSEVSRILFEIDPICINFGENFDEYDTEAHDIVARLQAGIDSSDVGEICRAVFQRWFSPEMAGEFKDYNLLGEKIEDVWNRFKKRYWVYAPVESK
ncbi:hypothetical protein AAHK20_08380 [Trinickia sp. YCB016]